MTRSKRQIRNAIRPRTRHTVQFRIHQERDWTGAVIYVGYAKLTRTGRTVYTTAGYSAPEFAQDVLDAWQRIGDHKVTSVLHLFPRGYYP